MKQLLLIVLLLAPAALADSYYGPNGSYQGRAQSDGRGNTSYYDASGRYQGRATTDSRGNTSYYDASGRYQGRAQQNSNGNTAYYSANGSYQGRAQQNGNSTSYYGANGSYQGRAAEKYTFLPDKQKKSCNPPTAAVYSARTPSATTDARLAELVDALD